MKRISALGETTPAALTGPGLEISCRDFANMIFIAAWSNKFGAVSKIFAKSGIRLPKTMGSVTPSDAAVAMAVAPGRWLVELVETNYPKIDPDIGSITDLSHARCSYLISGPNAVQLAQKLAPVDFDMAEYGPGRALQTGSNHTLGFTMWRQEKEKFVIYAERSYGRDFWHNLQAESAEFGVR